VASGQDVRGFQELLVQTMRARDYYQRRGDSYLLDEVVEECEAWNCDISESELEAYLRSDSLVLPSSEHVRGLARALKVPRIVYLLALDAVEQNDSRVIAAIAELQAAKKTPETDHRKLAAQVWEQWYMNHNDDEDPPDDDDDAQGAIPIPVGPR